MFEEKAGADLHLELKVWFDVLGLEINRSSFLRTCSQDMSRSHEADRR